jgi:hypothetical protein
MGPGGTLGPGRRPVQLAAALLLAAAATGCGERAGQAPWFVDRTADSGVDFTYRSAALGDRLLPESTGAGVGLLDIEGDGDLDLYLVQAGYPVLATPAPDAPTGRLYRNDGELKFTDITAGSGLDDRHYGQGVAAGDVNGDGKPDLAVLSFGALRLYINSGDGTFEDRTEALGIGVAGWPVSGAFCDYDKDEDLDLYVAQYVVFDPAVRCNDYLGRHDYCGPQNFPPLPDTLLRNDGDTFTDVSEAAGLTATAGPSMGVVCEDFDQDGWLDFAVSNDGAANHLWRNRGDGTFDDIAVASGVAFNMHGFAEAGMGLIAPDLDGDSWRDLFVTHLAGETNTLYRNLGAVGSFIDETAARFPGAPSLPDTGWGTWPVDVDLDGDIDLPVANGGVRIIERPGVPLPTEGPAEDGYWPRYYERQRLFLNGGDGKFSDVEMAQCGFCAQLGLARGLAAGDLDADGDQDLVLGFIEGPARIYENRVPRAGKWLRVRALQPGSGDALVDAVSAQVTVEAGGRTWHQTVNPNMSYASTGDPRAHFGLGDVGAVDGLTVRWPDGTVERFEAGCVDCDVVLRRGEGVAE